MGHENIRTAFFFVNVQLIFGKPQMMRCLLHILWDPTPRVCPSDSIKVVFRPTESFQSHPLLVVSGRRDGRPCRQKAFLLAILMHGLLYKASWRHEEAHVPQATLK